MEPMPMKEKNKKKEEKGKSIGNKSPEGRRNNRVPTENWRLLAQLKNPITRKRRQNYYSNTAKSQNNHPQ